MTTSDPKQEPERFTVSIAKGPHDYWACPKCGNDDQNLIQRDAPWSRRCAKCDFKFEIGDADPDKETLLRIKPPTVPSRSMGLHPNPMTPMVWIERGHISRKRKVFIVKARLQRRRFGQPHTVCEHLPQTVRTGEQARAMAEAICLKFWPHLKELMDGRQDRRLHNGSHK